jgi:hypothetical protein
MSGVSGMQVRKFYRPVNNDAQHTTHGRHMGPSFATNYAKASEAKAGHRLCLAVVQSWVHSIVILLMTPKANDYE